MKKTSLATLALVMNRQGVLVLILPALLSSRASLFQTRKTLYLCIYIPLSVRIIFRYNAFLVWKRDALEDNKAGRSYTLTPCVLIANDMGR